MLHELLTLYRDAIISRTWKRVGVRMALEPPETVLEYKVPIFLEQLASTLRSEQRTPALSTSPDLMRSAIPDGTELRHSGHAVAQIVHAYGDVCQVVAELAGELAVPISAEEFKTLNDCLDEAIAQTVDEYACQRDSSHAYTAARRGFLLHEERNLLQTAILAFEVLKMGTGVGGSTSRVLGRNLLALRDLIDSSLVEVRLETGLHHRERVALREFVEDAAQAATLDAHARGVQLSVCPVESGVGIEVDRQLIASAVANLLQNALKFNRPNGHVVLRTQTTSADRVLIEVEDECGGLPPGRAEDLFRPFAQCSADRSGLGLGLAIAQESVAANGGQIRVRNLPGRGCVFAIDLPRVHLPPAALGSNVAVAKRAGVSQ